MYEVIAPSVKYLGSSSLLKLEKKQIRKIGKRVYWDSKIIRVYKKLITPSQTPKH